MWSILPAAARSFRPRRFIAWGLGLVVLALLWTGASRGDEAFETPSPGRAFQFPRDHGSHPAFKTEWWYFVGRLKGPSGEFFGYQFTFFRVALRKPDPRARSAWSLHTIYFAHLAVSDPGRGLFQFREKAGRGALNLAGASPEKFQVWIDSWQAQQEGEDFKITARADDLGLDLVLKPLKPPALHGQGGYSRKAEGAAAASYYYSLPRLQTTGRVTVAGRSREVRGESWMDHEFFTSSMAPGLTGWDWFALQLADGREVMLYLLRRRDGSLDGASSGSLIDPDGKVQPLNRADFRVKATGAWKSPHSGAKYPAGWEITIPGAGYHLTLTPTLPDQEVRAGAPARVTYWEGQVTVTGRQGSQPLTGHGYVELTGYAGPMAGRF